MSITVAGRKYRTLSDEIAVDGKKVYQVIANDKIVYPESGHRIRLRLRKGVTKHSYEVNGTVFRRTDKSLGDVKEEFKDDGASVTLMSAELSPYSDSFLTEWREYSLDKVFEATYQGDITLTITSDKPFGYYDENKYEESMGSYTYRREYNGFPFYVDDRGYTASTANDGIKPVYLQAQPLCVTGSGHYEDVPFPYGIEGKIPLINNDAMLDVEVSGTVSCTCEFHDERGYIAEENETKRWKARFEASCGAFKATAKQVNSRVFRNHRMYGIDQLGVIRFGSEYGTVPAYPSTPYVPENAAYLPLTHVGIAMPNPDANGSVICIFSVADDTVEYLGG